MAPLINGIGAGGMRVHTRASQPRTSSNRTFQEQFKSGLKGGIDLTNSALYHIAKPITGSAALSATLSDAARNLSSGTSIANGPAALPNAAADGDINSLQDEMLKSNQEMLEQQMRCSQITTAFSTRSHILKAMFDTLRTMGSNIR